MSLEGVELLHSGPLRKATLRERLDEAIVSPIIVTGVVFLYGLPGAVLSQLSYIGRFLFSQKVVNPIMWVDLVAFRLLNPWHWRDLIFAGGAPPVLAGSDQNWGPVKGPLIANASGTVLEVGSGSGMNLFYYDAKAVKHLYAMEPFEGLHKELRSSLHKASQKGLRGEGLEDKCTIVPHGVQDYADIARYGIKEGSIDSIVLVQVLCSIENPRSHIGSLIKYLKPGGKLIMFEHVRSPDAISSRIQTLYTRLYWRFLMNGCELDRPSGEWVAQMGDWDSVDIRRPVSEHSGGLFPHAVAIFTKRKS